MAFTRRISHHVQPAPTMCLFRCFCQVFCRGFQSVHPGMRNAHRHAWGSRYDALLLPSAQGAMIDLASSQSLARIIRHFVSEQKPLCAVSHGVAALCCAVDEDKSWAFSGYSITGPTVFELVRRADFSTMQLIVEDFARDAGAVFSASQSGVVHVVVDRHVVTGQNEQSTLTAVQNLVLLCGMRK
uniref:Glutamine amidotransferase-like class 1 domain-containing protein 1 n=1 Tax=Eptatretus burgeri TaxID=7764 RepID=A0A8C4MZV4_EPTBU